MWYVGPGALSNGMADPRVTLPKYMRPCKSHSCRSGMFPRYEPSHVPRSLHTTVAAPACFIGTRKSGVKNDRHDNPPETGQYAALLHNHLKQIILTLFFPFFFFSSSRSRSPTSIVKHQRLCFSLPLFFSFSLFFSLTCVSLSPSLFFPIHHLHPLLHQMVSPLWNAASEGNIDILLGLLHNTSPADIEIKGISLPLIPAISRVF